MIFRFANATDIPQIQIVRNAVRENTLSDPALVTDDDCETFINVRGKGWVCETDNRIVGFAIADLKEDNIWALFVHPDFEKQGIGKKLHDLMLDWYFSQGKETVWLGTAPATRAEYFYKKAGWKIVGTHGKGEIKFEMTRINWDELKCNSLNSLNLSTNHNEQSTPLQSNHHLDRKPRNRYGQLQELRKKPYH